MLIMRHPDTGWINYGAYRVQVHDRNVASVMCSKGKHGNIILRHYQELGQRCPVAVALERRSGCGGQAPRAGARRGSSCHL